MNVYSPGWTLRAELESHDDGVAGGQRGQPVTVLAGAGRGRPSMPKRS